jgi:recombination protein RecR
MMYYPPSIQNLIKHISRLPGIGEKTAERLAIHLLHAPRAENEALAKSIEMLKDNIRQCRRCYGLSDTEVCRICGNPHRDPAFLCVVELPADMISIEKSGAFSGLYHILDGALSPMDGVGPNDIRIKELIDRVSAEKIEEVVLATCTSVEGEATATYIAEKLHKLPVKVTRIASGVPMGGDLKYVDQVTMKRAMTSRHEV